jgi:opacity protein-like surface antigen
MRKLAFLCGLVLALAVSASAQDYPKAEVFGGYSYLHTSIAGTGFSSNGASGSISVNPNNWVGLVGDFGVYHRSVLLGTGVNTVTYLFGPKFAYRHSDKLTPYFHFLLGGAHVSGSGAFALAFGGGFDAKVTPHVAVRLIQADYVLTKFNDGANNRQSNARISAGIVFRPGGR